LDIFARVIYPTPFLWHAGLIGIQGIGASIYFMVSMGHGEKNFSLRKLFG